MADKPRSGLAVQRVSANLVELLCLIKHRKAMVDCEISDYVTENEGNLVSANLDILIKKKQAYEWVISDLQT